MEEKTTIPEQKSSAPSLKKDWKYYTGMTCLVMSLVFPVFALFVPFLGLPTWLTATIIGLLTVGAPEVMILLAVGFLGKEGIQYFKAKLWAWFKRPQPFRPVPRWRYYGGLGIMLASSIPLYLKAYSPHLLPQNPVVQFYILVVSDLIFVLSFFVAGGEFWEKFKRLFVYEGLGAVKSG